MCERYDFSFKCALPRSLEGTLLVDLAQSSFVINPSYISTYSQAPTYDRLKLRPFVLIGQVPQEYGSWKMF